MFLGLIFSLGLGKSPPAAFSTSRPPITSVILPPIQSPANVGPAVLNYQPRSDPSKQTIAPESPSEAQGPVSFSVSFWGSSGRLWQPNPAGNPGPIDGMADLCRARQSSGSNDPRARRAQSLPYATESS